MFKAWLFSFFLIQIWLGALAGAEPLDVKNFNELAKQLGFQAEYSNYVSLKKKNVRIAVLDSGFRTYEEELGKTLPRNTTLHKPPLVPGKDEQESISKHGLFMAELLVKFMTDNNKIKELEPELHLFPYTSLYSNFEWSIKEAIRLKVDIILFSTVRDYGGNFDGKGFINSLVNQALDAGIFWVNAAGNYAQSTYNAAVEVSQDGWVKLPGTKNTIGVRCEPITGKKDCHLRLTLSWTDFKDDKDIGTDKDLDLFLFDGSMKKFEDNKGVLTQKLQPKDNEPGASKYPREVIDIVLKKGVYFARIENVSKNFTNVDKLRLVGDGDGISFEQKTSEESLLNPADNARVLTVGDMDTDHSSMSRKLNKPEVYSPSIIKISKNDSFAGTSNAAAIVAAGIGLIKMLQPGLTREQFLAQMAVPQQQRAGTGLPLEALGFGPTDPSGCFQSSQWRPRPLPQPVQYNNGLFFINEVLNNGGIPVNTTAGIRIFVPFDPIQLAQRYWPGMNRIQGNDMIMVTPVGYQVRPRVEMMMPAPPNMIEVVQLPAGQVICGINAVPRKGAARVFQLPVPNNN